MSVSTLPSHQETLLHTRQGLEDIPFWLGFSLPTLAWLIPYVVLFTNVNAYQAWMHGELGMVEILTVALLLITVILSARLFLITRNFPFPAFRIWILLLTLGCFYFMGEEASWGQHYFHWATPEKWHNYQGETNLHNLGQGDFHQLTWTSPKFIFSIVPRFLLSMGIILGGIVFPLVIFKGILKVQPNKHLAYWLMPTLVCVPVAILATVTGGMDKLFTGLNIQFAGGFQPSYSEIKENLYTVFLLLYVGSLTLRHKQFQSQQQ